MPFSKKRLEVSIIKGKHENRPQNGLFDPNFSCSNIHIVYNTPNNAVNYIQKHVFRVKIVLFKKK